MAVIYEKKFKKETQISLKVSDNSLTIVTDEGDIELSDMHEQDCCESVYADWSAAESYKDQLKGKTERVQIRGVAEDGFIIDFSGYYSNPLTKIFVPCYNRQNGYYGSGLELVIKDGVKTEKHDISDYVDDVID